MLKVTGAGSMTGTVTDQKRLSPEQGEPALDSMAKLTNSKLLWFEVNQRPGPGLRRRTFEADECFLEGHSRWDFEAGHPIEKWESKGFFAASRPDMEGPLTDVLATSNMLPVFSERLKECCEAAGFTGLQYLPVGVYKSDYETNPQRLATYFLINILNNVVALDEEKSEFTRESLKKRDGTLLNWISYIKRPILKSKALSGLDIIRLLQPSGTIYISPKFKALFEQGRFTGIGFVPVELS